MAAVARPEGIAESVKAAFRKADPSCSGLISRGDLRKLLRHLDVGQTLGATELDDLLDCLELEDTGRFDYEAFVDWLLGPQLSLGGSGDIVKVTVSTWFGEGTSVISLDVPWGTTVKEVRKLLKAQHCLEGSIMAGYAELPDVEPLGAPRYRAFDFAVSAPTTDVNGDYYFPDGAVPGARVYLRNVRPARDVPLDVLDYFEGVVVSMARATRTMVFFWRKHVGKGYSQFNVVYNASWTVHGPSAAEPFGVATGLHLKRCKEPPFVLPGEVQELFDGVTPADKDKGRWEQVSSLLSNLPARRTVLRVLLQDLLTPTLAAWDARAAEEALARRLGCRTEGSLELLLAAAVRDLESLRALVLEGGSAEPRCEAGRQEGLALQPARGGAAGQGAVLWARRREQAGRDELQVKCGTFRHVGGGVLLCEFSSLVQRDVHCWHEWQVKTTSADDKEVRIDLKGFIPDPYSRFLSAVQAGKDWMDVPQLAKATQLIGWVLQ